MEYFAGITIPQTLDFSKFQDQCGMSYLLP